MIIIGNSNIPFIDIQTVQSKSDITNTKSNCTVAFKYDIELLKYCSTNGLKSLVMVQNLQEAIFANSLNALYIVTDNNLSKKIQKIAENYMFDSKIIEIINNDDEIESIAVDGIDGVIYKRLIGEIL